MFKKALIFFAFFSLMGTLGCSSLKVRPINELNSAKAIYEEGLKLVRDKEYNVAMTYFKYVVENYKSPKDEKYYSWATYEIGFCLYMKGEEKQSIPYFDRVLMTAKTRGPRILSSLLKRKIESGQGYKNAQYDS